MTIADARNHSSLRQAMLTLGNNQPLSEFLEAAPTLGLKEKQTIIRQAKLLLAGVYAHLPLKRAGHAVDPVQQLELLEHRLNSRNHEQSLLSDWAFHSEMLNIFKGLRDVHTKYRLPEPFRTCTAFLPFMIEDYIEDGRRQFLVTHVQAEFKHKTFKPGVVVTHWNGTPIERAVQLHADREDGSNAAARFAIGLATMTARPLATQMPPDEEWVIVRFDTATSKENDILFPWRVWNRKTDGAPPKTITVNTPQREQIEALSSTNERVDELHDARKHMFARDAVEAERRIADATQRKAKAVPRAKGKKKGKGEPDEAPPERALREAQRAVRARSAGFDRRTESRFPGAIRFKTVVQDRTKYGYIRLRNFRHPNPFEFVAEIQRIVRMMPINGLILDVRGNGGGLIPSGEMILQLFSSEEIEPAQFQFINTDITARLCTEPKGSIIRGKGESERAFKNRKAQTLRVRRERKVLATTWGSSIRQSNLTGAAFSIAKPLTDPRLANNIGQHYFGPVILITDAQCYSTTDIFAAGFQDHAIGKIMGVDVNTGAGGANMWTHHRQLLPYLVDDGVGIEQLPSGVAMSVSIRRSLRVGPRFGQPLEDLGVTPDIHYDMTKRDLLKGNQDMIETAISELQKGTVRNLIARFIPAGRDSIGFVICRNIDRIDVYYDGRPVHTQDIRQPRTEVHVPFTLAGVGRLEVHGFQTVGAGKRRAPKRVARVVHSRTKK